MEAMEDRVLLTGTLKSLIVLNVEHGAPSGARNYDHLSKSSQSITADLLRAPRQSTTLSQVSGYGLRGTVATFTATLSSAQTPLIGKTVRFQLAGRIVGSAITNSQGAATLSNVGIKGLRAGVYPAALQASFAGDRTYKPISARSALTVSHFPTTFSAVSGSGTYGDKSVLTAKLTSNGTPIVGRSIEFLITGQSVGSALTNSQGVAKLSTNYAGLLNVETYVGAITVRVNASTDFQRNEGSGPLTITPAHAALTLGNLNQTVDGSTKSVSVTADPASLGYRVIYKDVNNRVVPNPSAAGSYQVTVTSTNPNYQGSATGTLLLTPALVHITPTLGNLSQTYNGTPRSVTVTAVPAGLTYSVTYTDSSNRPVTNPTDAGSYLVTATCTSPNYAGCATGTLVIAKAQLQVNGIIGGSRTYDGTNQTTVDTQNATLTGVVAGDQVTLSTSQVQGTFANRNVGAARTVTISGLAISGADTGNYVLVQPTITADITAVVLSVSGFVAAGKTYDGTKVTTADGSNATIQGVVTGDQVILNTINASGQFDTKDVGNAKPVNILGLTISGSDVGNYVLPLNVQTTADVIQANVEVTGIIAADKPFDGTNNAVLDTTNAALVGVVPTDDVALVTSGAVGYFDTFFVGQSINVTIYGLSLSGSDAANYYILNSTTMANITE